ncbi:MAG: vWA domain-containing protein [Planctomycetota bacterium]|nr:vWA domain-containing protein [Planctomycetota bacterium]
MARRRAAGLDALVLGALLLALGGLAAWIGAPSGAATDEDALPPVRALLADLSASVTRSRPAAAIDLVGQLEDQARAAARAGEQVLLITFATGATRRFGPGSAEAFLQALRSEGAGWLAPPDADLASDVAAAAALARSVVTAERRRPGRVVLLGDGRWTGADPGPLLLSPAMGALEWVEPGPATVGDVELVRLRAPARAEPGVPARVDVDLRVAEGPSVALELSWRLLATSTETLTRGTNREELVGEGRLDVDSAALFGAGGDDGSVLATVPLTLPALGEGSARVEVALSGPEGGDAFPENDRGSASWQVGDPLRVLVLAGTGVLEDAARIAGLFVGRAFEGIEFVPAELDGLERTLDASRAPDVVMTFGTGPLPLPQAELAGFIEGGGGYVHWAGWSRLVADGGRLSRLLVLEPDVEPREPRDIVFLVDGSGSMKGPRWIRAKAALGRLLPSVPPRDRFELRFFTQVLGSPRLTYAADPDADPSRTAARRRDALRSLRDIEVPGGSTDITGSVAQLAARLGEEAADVDEPRASLIVLLTDGVPTLTGEDPGRVRARLTEAGHELAVIQVGERRGGPTRTLRGLAGGAENVLQAGELEDVLGILQEAIQGTTLVEAAELRARGPEVASLADAVASARASATLETPLVVARALPCRVVDGAAGIFELEPSDPEGRRGALAAIAQRGAGTVVGIALPLIDADGARWAPRLEARLDWLAPLLRAAGARAAEARAARTQDRALRAALEETPRQGIRLMVRGPVDSAGWRTTGTLRVPASGVEAAIELTRSPAGAWAAPRPDLLDVLPRGTALELEVEGRRVFLEADGPAELRAGSDRAALVGEWTGARSRVEGVTDPAGEPASPPGRGPHPLAPWLLVAGAAALFAGALAAR